MMASLSEDHIADLFPQPECNGNKAEVKPVRELCSIISGLLDNAALDEDEQAQDCLEVFDEYDWQPAAGIDQTRFDELVSLGLSGDTTPEELKGFVELVSPESEKHLFCHIRAGKSALKKYADFVK